MGKMSQILNYDFYLSRQASCLLVISRVGPEKKHYCGGTHLNRTQCVFCSFLHLY